jgi:integrase
VAALTPEQVDLLLAAAAADPKPWLGAWTVLAAASGARNGELCALEWSDLDLDAGTVRFRQALTNLETAHLPAATPAAVGEAPAASQAAGSNAEDRRTRRRRELVVGPVKSKASKAILNLPPFAVAALRRHRHQQRQLRLAGTQPPTIALRWVEPGQLPRPVELDLVFRTQRGTALNPNHASRGFANLANSVGLDAHPHMLRHALASAMAANKEPASIIATQLRHADGGALAQRVYIHQLPQTAPRVAGLIEGVFGPTARDARSASAPGPADATLRETQAGGVA